MLSNKQPTPIKLSNFKKLLSSRPRDAHKGLFGHVLIIGGDHGMAGAVRLAGEAALRTGAGLVSIATRPDHIAAIVSGRPELMCHGVKNGKELLKLATRATVIVLGPGLGQSAWSKQLFKQALAIPLPKVVDADGLNLLARQPLTSDQWILTPHVGEAARLLHTDIPTIQKNRRDAAQQLQRNYKGVIVLKGAGSLVCAQHVLSLCQAGNPGMASGGMGDVLSGVIGALVAQHFNPQHAAELGVCIHAYAGDLAAQQHGERGLIASDLMPYLRELMNPS